MCGSYIGFTLLCDSGCLVELTSIMLLQAVTPIATGLNYLDEFMRAAIAVASATQKVFSPIPFHRVQALPCLISKTIYNNPFGILSYNS